MGNSKEISNNNFSREKLEEGLLYSSEVEESHEFLDIELGELFVVKSKRIIKSHGKKIGESPNECYETEPVKRIVDNEKVDVVVHMGKEEESFDIRVKMPEGSSEREMKLYFVNPKDNIRIKDNRSRNLVPGTAILALGLLESVERSLNKKRAEGFSKVKV